MVGHKNGWCVMDTMTYGGTNYPESRRGGRRPSWVGAQDRCFRHGIFGLDVPKLGPDPERGLMGFGCTNMGISSGCSDEYEASFDCQWIDITDTPDGYYWLTVATNWDEAGRNVTSPENDYSNNEANVAIRIQGTTVTKLSNAQIQQHCPVKPPPSPPPPSPAPPPYVDPNFNNSCFGGPASSTEADNGVCNDGGPGANSDICAFGTLCAGSI